jgi:hypothetical protein
VPRIPFDLGYEVVHGIGARLVIQPGLKRQGPLIYDEHADPYDRDQRFAWPNPKLHTCYAAFLAGHAPRCKPRQSVPPLFAWPVRAAKGKVATPSGVSGSHTSGASLVEVVPVVWQEEL